MAVERKLQNGEQEKILVNLPQIADEFPQIFSSEGEVEIKEVNHLENTLLIIIGLKEPVKVGDWRLGYYDGIGINAMTSRCIEGLDQRLRIWVNDLPKPGDAKIKLLIGLSLEKLDDNVPDLEDFRSNLTDFAAKINKTWYYHFKG